MRPFLGLVIGLVVGIAGATLYLGSLPPEEGSLEEKVEKGEVALAKAEKKIAALEVATGKIGRNKPGATFKDRTRRIAEEIRDGKLVSVDDVFGAFKPVMRDLSPLFERMRLREQEEHFDAIAGNLSREYNLTPAQEEALQAHLEKVAENNAKRYMDVLTSDGSSFEDFVRAGREFEREDGLDEFMVGTLRGEELEQFQAERLAERADRVQHEADRKMERLDRVVGLDEAQKDRVFTMMARSSRDFDPAMGFDGLSGETGALGAGSDRNAAILSVLRPEQRTAYEEHRRERREKAEADLRAVGMRLPENWDVFDEGDF